MHTTVRQFVRMISGINIWSLSTLSTCILDSNMPFFPSLGMKNSKFLSSYDESAALSIISWLTWSIRASSSVFIDLGPPLQPAILTVFSAAVSPRCTDSASHRKPFLQRERSDFSSDALIFMSFSIRDFTCIFGQPSGLLFDAASLSRSSPDSFWNQARTFSATEGQLVTRHSKLRPQYNGKTTHKIRWQSTVNINTEKQNKIKEFYM